jgi:hypothetical protein
MNHLDSTNDYVEFYLTKLKNRDFDSAFHSLTEVGHSVIPKLIDAFRSETAPDIRAELVRIIWNHRQPETVEFLEEALRDSHPEVWKCALDGLVTLATPSALQTLKTALTRTFANKKDAACFRRWIEEAVMQVAEQIANDAS